MPNLEGIKGSLRRFGQRRPIVVGTDDVIQAGNGTWLAAKELGWEYIEIVRSPLTGSERTAYSIADNATALSATWDDDLLVQQLRDLDEELQKATGFGDEDLQRMNTYIPSI